MKKRLSELIVSWLFTGFLMFALFVINTRANTIFSLANEKWFNYLFVFVFVIFFVGFAISVGFVFGLQRGKGRVVGLEDLIVNKPFKIRLIEPVGSRMFYVTIDVDGNSRILKTYREVPKDATHLRVTEAGLGFVVEYLEITPEVPEVVKILSSC